MKLIEISTFFSLLMYRTLAYLYQMELYRFCCPFGKEIQSEILNTMRVRERTNKHTVAIFERKISAEHCFNNSFRKELVVSIVYFAEA